jgi:transcriptional regulator with GAF, ATPase, and Fis domain
MRITLIDESEPGHSVSYEARDVSIGRVEGNDLVLPVAHISSQHARIRHRGGKYLVSDLGSTNGTLVLRESERLFLGAKGLAELELQSGDLLLLGDIDHPVRLRVVLGPGSGSPLEAVGATVAVATRSRGDTLAISQRITGHHDALQVIFHLVEAIGAARDRDQILARVAEAALQAVPGAVDALVVVRASGGALETRAEAHRGRGVCRTANDTVCEQVLRGEVALLFGEHDDSALPAHTLASQGVGSGIAAPLWGDEEVMGVLQVNCQPGQAALRELHLDVAVVLAHHAAVALERADLIARLQAAERQLRQENAVLRRRAQPSVEMVAQSPAMTRVVEDLRRAAASDVTVLLQGETGTGKEVAARLVHESSPRRAGLLIPVNCGALTESLLDSELFGHRKGAFTGASSDRKGVFEVAGGGTVFLDEIGETPPAVQVRLLRVLEESTIKVVGDSVERPVDVRIIAASNRDLDRLVQQGTFRQDLYYRLRVFPVTLPPLRERPEDIEPLCQLFLTRYAYQLGKRVAGIDPAVLEVLRGYRFPGNIRELANEIERAVVRVEEGEMLTADLFSDELFPVAHPAAGEGGALREQLAGVERQIIERTLARHGGSKVAAARELGLTRQGLAKKMERLGLRG